MIKNEYLVPEFYINKVPYCDKCSVELHTTGAMLLSNPAKIEYRCPKCNNVTHYSEDLLRGEWKWRTI